MEKIRNYVGVLFEDAPKTKKVRELKEELSLDLEEKYEDLLRDGQSEKDAYQEVITGIGNIDELIGTLKVEPTVPLQEQMRQRKKTALVVSASVGLYMLALIMTIILEEMFALPDSVVASTLFGICGVATCILIYHFMSMPKYEKKEDTIVEDFKEWKSTKVKNRYIRNSMSGILWTFIVVIYFMISFIFSAWYISWIIFIIGALIEQIIELLYRMRG